MHQPQAKDAHPLASPPFPLLSPPVPCCTPPTPPPPRYPSLEVFFLPRCSTCAFTVSSRRPVSFFMKNPPDTRSLSVAPCSDSLFRTFTLLLLSISTLELTWRESYSHNITLQLGPACDLLSTQSLFPWLHQPGQAELQFVSASYCFWKGDGHCSTLFHTF